MPEHGDLIQIKFALVDTYLTFTHSDKEPWYLCPIKWNNAYPWNSSIDYGNTKWLPNAYMFDMREEAQEFAKQIKVRSMEIVRVVQQFKVEKTWQLDEDIKSSPRLRDGKLVAVTAKATAL